jgi:hypothetical protein
MRSSSSMTHLSQRPEEEDEEDEAEGETETEERKSEEENMNKWEHSFTSISETLKCTPSFANLLTMREEDLSKVTAFSVENPGVG